MLPDAKIKNTPRIRPKTPASEGKRQSGQLGSRLLCKISLWTEPEAAGRKDPGPSIACRTWPMGRIRAHLSKKTLGFCVFCFG